MYLAHYTKRFIPEFDAECRLHYAYQLNQLVPNNQQVQQLIQFIRYSNR